VPAPWLRIAGAVSLAVSAVAFLIGLTSLYMAEGPSAPDLWVYLASPSNRQVLNTSTFALTAAVLLLYFGLVIVSMTLPAGAEALGRIARSLGAVAAAAFVGFLSLQYALTAVLAEGVDPASATYRALALQEHAAVDWAGWTGIVLLAGALLLLGIALAGQVGRRLTGWSAVAVAAIGLLLIPTGFGFAFTLLAGIWALIAAVDLFRRSRRGG
jgi:hypothetical protein